MPIPGDPNRCADKKISCNASSEFACTLDNVCIKYELTCDGIHHCPDGSDEDIQYCAIRDCKSGFLHCANGRCLHSSSWCNEKDDCGDYSDEAGCVCPSDKFRCTKGGPCLDLNLKCNGVLDCINDASDETYCPPVDCSENGMQNCANTTACILPDWICDGKNDCWDNSDEEHCLIDVDGVDQDRHCPLQTFQCHDNKCIAESWVCDRELDCADGFDEEGCQYNCTNHQFSCDNGQCIPK